MNPRPLVDPDTLRNPLFIDVGDSGSVLLNDAFEIVGLLFAWGSGGTAVANPIADVLSTLNTSVCT